MRAVLLLVMLAGAAHADRKIRSLIPPYKNELAACQVQQRGIDKVATGATELAKTLAGPEREEIERDAAQLTRARELFVAYCGDVARMLELLDAQADAAYRKVEREIDSRDNQIRKYRRDAKKVLEEIGPITRKLIPRIASRPVAAPPPRPPAQFPSGRTVELPALAGQWKVGGTPTHDTVAYADKGVTASVSTRAFTGATCAQHRRIQPRDVDVEPPKDAKIDWAVRSVRKETAGAHVVVTACAQRGTGGAIVIADVAPDTAAILDDITRLAFRMLAARDGK